MNIKYPGSLHGHTDLDSNIRIKDSIITVDEAIDYAIELGHELVAFTGHEALCSHMAALDKYAKIKKENPNFKVILGNEIYLCRNGLNSSNYVAKQDRFWHFILNYFLNNLLTHPTNTNACLCVLWLGGYQHIPHQGVPLNI